MDGEISTDEVEQLIDGDAADGDPPTVVDIREPPAYRQGHIPDSVNVPFRELPDRVAELADADHVVTVCPHGKASVQAARLIGSYEGVDDARVESMAGGLEAWDGPVASAAADGESDEGPEAPF